MVRNEHGRHHDFHDVERLIPMFGVPFQKIPVGKDSHNIVDGILVHRQAGMAFAVQHLDKFVQGRFHVDSAHVHTGSHDFTDRSLHEVEDVENHLLFFFFEAFGIGLLAVGKVRLHGIAPLFGEEAKLGIVAQALQNRHKKNVTDFGRNRKRNANELEERNQHHRQGIGLEGAEKVRAKDGYGVNADAGHNKVSQESEHLEFVHPIPRNHLEQVNAQNTTPHIAEDAADGDGLVEAVVLHDGGHFLFATFPILGLSLGVNAAERGFD